jgi:predicted dehydrogenase
LLIWMMGSKPKRMTSIVKRIATPESYTKLDDAFVILIEFENGAIGWATGDRYSPVVGNINEFYGTEGQLFLSTESTNPFQTSPVAFYTHKNFKWDELPDVVRKARYPVHFWAEDLMGEYVPRRWVSIYPPREWSYTRMWAHFVDCILTGAEPMMKAEDGAIVMDILCGAFKAWEDGRWLDLPLKEEIVPPMFKPYYKPF